MIPDIFTILPLFELALLLGAAVYECVVIAPNYEHNIPASLDLARQFMARTTPANYFRVVAPITLALLIAGVVITWESFSARWAMLAATLVLGVADTITYTFHYPRLRIMFRSEWGIDPVILWQAARGWALGNLVRAGLLALSFLCELAAVVNVVH